MKTLNQNKGIQLLADVRESFRDEIESKYEPAAKNCQMCEVQGTCCTDTHFVNVHISRLEAVAIKEAINDLEPAVLDRVIARSEEAVEFLGSGFSDTYSCPLFEKGSGCLIHDTAKPFPCINHACYENADDLPPSVLLEISERVIGKLNDAVYRSNWNWMPIPVWLRRVLGNSPQKESLARETHEKHEN